MSLPLEVQIAIDGRTVLQPTGLFINNQFIPSANKATLDAVDPATGNKITSVYAGTKQDVDIAVKHARKCFEKTWKEYPRTEIGKLMFQLVRLMERDKEILSLVEALDSGKPYHNNAVYDVAHSIDVFRYYAGWADKCHGEQIPTTPQKLVYTIHEPHGVCGQIIPWNYPLAMAIWKIAPAIAAGNVLVMKSSELTPLSLLQLCKLFAEAGFPPGVLNVVTGDGEECGSAIAAHPDIDKVSFTGSTAVGKFIQRAAADNLKAVTMECGGKSPLVVCADCDMDQAVKWTAFGVMYNMGQICIATSRVYVHADIYQAFIDKLIEHVQEKYVQGKVFDEKVHVGPQISKKQQQRVLEYIEKGVNDGAKLVLGGGIPQGLPESSCYVEPTIFADCSEDMTIVKEEIFGPVLSISKFHTDDEVIAKANDSIYGLGAAIFTGNLVKAHEFARKVESGQVWINSTNASDFRVPFGGVKQSGFGRELGEYGLRMYTQTKAVHVNLGSKL